MTTGFSPPTDSLHGPASSLNPIVLVIGLFPALVIYRVFETGFLLYPADIKPFQSDQSQLHGEAILAYKKALVLEIMEKFYLYAFYQFHLTSGGSLIVNHFRDFYKSIQYFWIKSL